MFLGIGVVAVVGLDWVRLVWVARGFRHRLGGSTFTFVFGAFDSLRLVFPA